MTNYDYIELLNEPIAKLFWQILTTRHVDKVNNSIKNNCRNFNDAINTLIEGIKEITLLTNEQLSDVQLSDVGVRLKYVLYYYLGRTQTNDDSLSPQQMQEEYTKRANLLKNNEQNNYSLLDFAGKQLKIGTFNISNHSTETSLTVSLDLETLNLTIAAVQKDFRNKKTPKLVHYVFPPSSEIQYFDFTDNKLKDGDQTSDFLDFITTLRFDSIHKGGFQIHYNNLNTLGLDVKSDEYALYEKYYSTEASTPHIHFYQKKISKGLDVLKHLDVEESYNNGYRNFKIYYKNKRITTVDELKTLFSYMPDETKFKDYAKHIKALKEHRGNSYSLAINEGNIANYLKDLNVAMDNHSVNSPILKYDLGMPFLYQFGGPIYQIADSQIDSTDDTVVPSNDDTPDDNTSGTSENILDNKTTNFSKTSEKLSREIARKYIENKLQHATKLLAHVNTSVSDGEAKKIIKNHSQNIQQIVSSETSYRSKSILVLAELYECINSTAKYLTGEQLTSFTHFVTNYSYNNFALSNDFSFESAIVLSNEDEEDNDFRL